MIGRATCDEDETAAPFDLLHVVPDTAQDDRVVLEIHSTTHRVYHRLWRALLHERLVIA